MPRRSAAIVLLVGLVAADVVLVTGALRSNHVDTSQLAQAAAENTASPASSPSPSGSATTSSGTGTGQALLGKVTVSALNSTRAWRAATPSMLCTSNARAATIGHTQDGGNNWTTVHVPMTTISSLSYANGRIIATGLNSSCKPATYALSSTLPPSKVTTQTTWAVDPTDVTKLLSSGNPVPQQPCATGVLDVAANSPSDVVVLCADGSVQHSTDTGASWKKTKPQPGIVAIATGPSSVYTATRTTCGIAVSSKTTAATNNCVTGTKDWKGPVDMTIVSGTVWLATTNAAVTAPLSDFS